MEHYESIANINRSNRPAQSLVWIVLLCSFANVRALPAQGPADAEDQTLRVMFTRGLVQSALGYVQARIKLDKNGPSTAWWVMREMDCHARWALQDLANAAEHWDQCDTVAESYKSRLGDGEGTEDARWPWIQWQMGRCRLLRAQSALAKFLAAPTIEASRDQALELVRDIIQRTDELLKDIERRKPLAARRSASEAHKDELRNLDADTQLLKCEALMVRWQLYPSGSGDRAASLADVRKVAVEFMGNQTTAAGRASLEFAKALADLESGEEAALLELERLARHAGSNQIRVLAASNLARVLANGGQQSRAKTAIDLLEQTVSKDSSFAPQLALSRIEVELARLESNKAPNKEKELSALVQQALSLGKNYGDYWRTRAEALLVGKLSSDSVSDSQLAVDLLLAEARQLWAKGDQASMQDAAKRLLKGRDAQAAQGKASAAITLSNQAATLFRELKDWNNAVDAVRQTSIQFSTDPNAAQAHKWAIDAHVPRLKEKISDAAQRELYVELLREQIRLWPDAEVSRDSKRLLRDWCLGQGMRVIYIDALIESLPESKILDLGQSTILECAEQTLQLPNDARTKIVDGLLTGEALPAQHALSQLSKQTARAVAILSDLSTSDFCRSSSTRQQNWSEFEDRSAGLQPGLLGDFLECAADVGRIQLQLPINQASPGWNKLADSSRAALVVALVDVLDCLEPQAKIGYWTKLGLDKDWSKFDTKAYSAAVEVAAARVAIWSGDSTAGDQIKLRAEKERRDGQVQLMHAYWRADQRDWGAAKKIVTQLAGLSKTGSRLQLSAKWAMMRFQIASGEIVEAAQAAKLLIASQPNLDPIWLARFNAIGK